MANRKTLANAKTKSNRPPKSQSRKAMIEDLIVKMNEKVEKEAKGSVADLLRLIIAEREMEEEKPLDVVVTWVESKSDVNSIEE